MESTNQVETFRLSHSEFNFPRKNRKIRQKNHLAKHSREKVKQCAATKKQREFFMMPFFLLKVMLGLTV